MTPESKLDSLFAADAPPARDYAFEAEVARRVALRRAWLTAAATAPWAIVGTVLVWALVRSLGPALHANAEALAPTAMAVTVAAAGAAAALWLSRRFSAG